MTGLAGASLAIPAVGIQLHNTYFSIAHLHIALAGAICGAILAGLFHFWPRWWQSTLSDRLGKLSGIGMLAGICLAFLPWTILGANGLPSSLHVYPAEYQFLHSISTGGSILLVLSLATACAILFSSAVRRRVAASAAVDDSGGEFSYQSMTVRSAGGEKS
jgi:cytochrome c oxidase subunit 1